jgi:hypothetical protein
MNLSCFIKKKIKYVEELMCYFLESLRSGIIDLVEWRERVGIFVWSGRYCSPAIMLRIMGSLNRLEHMDILLDEILDFLGEIF